MRKILAALICSIFALGLTATSALPVKAQETNLPLMQLGMIGTGLKSPIEVAEMRVTYRFDQIGTGKSAQAVPVQMTYRLHNPAATQNIEVSIPTPGPEDEVPVITTIYVNGREQPIGKMQNKNYFGVTSPISSVSFNLTVAKDADAIVDVRALQPLAGDSVPFAFQTGRAWSGNINTGTVEAFFTFTTANWNVALRELKADPTMIPIIYSGKNTSWTFSEKDLQAAPDVFWQLANLENMAYYEQGLDAWRANNNDPQAYIELHRALLDLTPCHGETLPLATWWNNMYETISVGILSSLQGDEQNMQAMELYSASFQVPQGDNAACIAMQQRPERYRGVVAKLLAMPIDQRSSAVQSTLDKHFQFLRKLVAQKGENSLQDDPNNITNTDPYGDNRLSANDRRLLAQWDDRFAGTEPMNAANNQTQSPQKASSSFASSASSTINGILNKLPHLSFGTQVILLSILALIILAIIGFIIFKWQDTPTLPERQKDSSISSPTVPLMGMGLGKKINFADMNKKIDDPSAHEPENLIKVDPAEERTATSEQRTKDVNNNEPKPPLSI
ncbi:MAG: hypothetical protein WCT54_03430 [Patescibacteria group bacterium]